MIYIYIYITLYIYNDVLYNDIYIYIIISSLQPLELRRSAGLFDGWTAGCPRMELYLTVNMT